MPLVTCPERNKQMATSVAVQKCLTVIPSVVLYASKAIIIQMAMRLWGVNDT